LLPTKVSSYEKIIKMSYIKPTFHHPSLKPNKVGYLKKDYRGVISTLCAGCGHDSISGAIVQACYEISLEPHKLAKLFRRNLNMVYIVMNNGCYGLTKGQDSATADFGSISKEGNANPYQAIDLAGLALELNATFVGRSFSGDKSQLVPMIKAAMSHPGFAFLDVISPCVTFNNTKTSTKSYSHVRDHIEATSSLDYVPFEEEITVDYPEGDSAEVELFDGAKIHLSKLAPDRKSVV